VPLPPAISATLGFVVDQNTARVATLSVTFPALDFAQTTVDTLTGISVASGAGNVRADSALRLQFSEGMLGAGDSVALMVASGAISIAGQRVLSADRRTITFTPDVAFPYDSRVSVSGIYSNSGLKSMQGNPLYRPFSFNFVTQPAQTQPSSITKISLFPDADWSPLNAYIENQDFIKTGTVYIEARGVDASPNTVDFTNAAISTGVTVKLDETAVNSGIFRGSYDYANLADGYLLNVSSTLNPAASQTLSLSLPALSPSYPASGAVDVANAVTIVVKANEPLNADTVNAANVKLFRESLQIAGAVSYRPNEMEILFTPSQPLDYASEYIYRIANVRDSAGNILEKELVVKFSTQATSISPLEITSISAFSDNAFAAVLPDLALIAPSHQIYLEIVAADLSASTTDATQVTLRSAASGEQVTVTLIETAAGSGVFRGSATVMAEEDALINIFSVTDPSVSTRVRTFASPEIVALQPASGSTGIYLDTVFSLQSSKNIDAATVNKTNIIVTDSLGLASYTVVLNTPTEILVKTELHEASSVFIKITAGLKDTDGLAFAEMLVNYSSLTRLFSQFVLYADAAFTSQLTDGNQVEARQTVYAQLNGIDAFSSRVEVATASIAGLSSTSLFSLIEVSPGIFRGSFVVPELFNESLSVVPEGQGALARYLTVMPKFMIVSVSPVDAATNIAADVWPACNFTRPVRIADLDDAKFKLIDVSTGLPVPVTISHNLSGNQVRLQPTNILPLLTEFRIFVSGLIQDNAGNLLGSDFNSVFTTQPPPPPPVVITSLKNYENSDYATATVAVSADGILYLELIAEDTSFSTYESAKVRLDSTDAAYDGLELTLVEVSPPSGIYRLAQPVNLTPGTILTVRSQADPAVVLTVTARTRTVLSAISPASASADLFLDSPFTLDFSFPIDRNTVSAGAGLFSPEGISLPIRFTFSNDDKTLQITPENFYLPSTRYLL
ncbi:MAG: Ig-like domain-containing protein, partial [Candidatus Riflebacteria bacterium]|nr:Ig-like domain-containing protein [Candidatus Riflebacteria bacterium]